MTSAARAASTVGCVLLIFPAPAVSVISPAASPELMTTLPFVPAAALWMCPMLIAVPAGQPVMSVSKSAFAAVMVPLASFVVVSVKVPLPEHDASALAIAGTSFELLRSAVKTNLSWGVGAGVGVGVAATVGDAVGATAAGPQALRASAAAARPARRRIDTSSCTAVIRREIDSG